MMLSVAAQAVLNDGNLIRRRDEWFDELRRVFRGDPARENVFAVNGSVQYSFDERDDPEDWVIRSLNALAERAAETNDPLVFRPLCVEYGICGVHFVDRIFGAHVFFQDGQWYNDYLKTEVGTLQEPDLEHNATWRLARRAAEVFVRAGQGLALFGEPSIACALNVGMNLYGQELLVAMLLEPLKAKRDLAVINRLLIRIHEWYRATVPAGLLQPPSSGNRTQPPGCGQIDGCSTQLVSGDLYDEFIAPLDEELLAVYPGGGMMHLCGSHLQILESLRNMEHLHAVQLNDRAADDLESYFNGLREDQIIYLNPYPGMTVERAMEITGGHRLVIAGDIDRPIRCRPRVRP